MSIFKRKLERSEWMRGLLECENIYQNGGRQVWPEPVSSYLYLDNGKVCFCLSLEKYERAKGYLDYINYFENTLK